MFINTTGVHVYKYYSFYDKGFQTLSLDLNLLVNSHYMECHVLQIRESKITSFRKEYIVPTITLTDIKQKSQC